MSNLADIGRIEYNGFRFPVGTETVSVAAVPQWDDARRTVVYTKFTLTIKTRLVRSNLDYAMADLVARLTAPAAPFHYTSRGVPLVVNVGSVRDVLWGPMPELVELKPLGGGRAVRLTWRVTVHLPSCRDAVFTGPLEFNYDLSFSHPLNGSTTRTYRGHIRVAGTRTAPGNRSLPDTADRYREQVFPALPPGFKRTQRDWSLSADKLAADFTVVDEELGPNTPPPGIVECSADHTVASTPGNFSSWTGTLNATYEVARNGRATAADARNAFFALAKDRINHTIEELFRAGSGALGGNPVGDGKTTRKQEPAVLPVQFTMAEPALYDFGVKCRFSLVYKVVGADLRTMLTAAGLWRPTPDGGDWRKWATYLGDVAGPRGRARLVFDPKEDRIIDLCRRQSVTAELSGPRPTVGLPQNNPIPSGVFPDPRPDRSWLHYEAAFRLEVNDGTIPVQTLPVKPLPEHEGLLGAGGAIAGAVAAGWNGLAPGPLPATDLAVQLGAAMLKAAGDAVAVTRRKPTAYLYLTGKAVRLKYDIPCPAVTKVGKNDVEPVPANRADAGEGFWSSVAGNVGWPVQTARWNLRYLLPELPEGELPPPGNPMLGA